MHVTLPQQRQLRQDTEYERNFWSPVPGLHEFYGVSSACAMLAPAALALAASARRPAVLWVRQSLVTRETGAPCGRGLSEFGLAAEKAILVHVRDARAALQAGLEGARCPALGAVAIELWGETKTYDLTASRRLALAARTAGTPVFLTRLAAAPQASAADTRWLAGPAPSRPFAANAPGPPVLALTLLRARSGAYDGKGAQHTQEHRENSKFELEWDRDARRYMLRSSRATAPLSGAVAAVSLNRQSGADGWTATARKTG